MKNYYRILGIEPGAGSRDIRKAWLGKAQQLHPDHNPDDPTAEEQFKEAQEAYRILSDPFLRSRYDESGYESPVSAPAEHTVRHYFYAKYPSAELRQFEEFEVSFTYSGKGRLFRRPAWKDFFITGSPYISYRMVQIDQIPVRETTFRYILCPLITGGQTMGRAGITIGQQSFFTEPFQVHVSPVACHFTDHEPAGSKPLNLVLHHDFQGEESKAPVSEKKKNHTVLIPRSRTAYIFHCIGMTMKVVCMIWGAVMIPFYYPVPFLLAALMGSLVGGINITIMYRLAGVKSKFLHARKFHTVKNYLDRGYVLGESTGIPGLKSPVLYELQKLLF